jgi:hypothetical protein
MLKNLYWPTHQIDISFTLVVSIKFFSDIYLECMCGRFENYIYIYFFMNIMKLIFNYYYNDSSLSLLMRAVF